MSKKAVAAAATKSPSGIQMTTVGTDGSLSTQPAAIIKGFQFVKNQLGTERIYHQILPYPVYSGQLIAHWEAIVVFTEGS